MRIKITKNAEKDLDDIEYFIGSHNPARAETFIGELLDRCYALLDMPRAYPLVGRYRKLEVRRCIHGDYLIFYHISNDVIIITRILNGAKNYDALKLDF